jgi:DNA-directed RNA polymerase subunit M
MFCPTCGSLMVPSDGHLVCRRCEKEYPLNDSKEVVVSGKAKESKEILVIEEEAETLPKANVECPECGHNEAFWVLRQMRGSDEPETRIYRCTKCKNTWRED